MRTRDIFLKNWVFKAFVGIHPHEYRRPQKLRLNITLVQADADRLDKAHIEDVVDYEAHYRRISTLTRAGHIPLLETLAEKIALACLEDPKVLETRVKIEKLGLFPGMESCGVELVRERTPHP